MCRIGIVGFGNMGSALAAGFAEAFTGRDVPFRIAVYASRKEQKEAAGALGLLCAASARELAGNSDILIVAVRPEQVGTVVRECAGDLFRSGAESSLLVSIAAGVLVKELEAWAGQGRAVARVMPNTLCSVGKGAFGMCAGSAMREGQMDLLQELFGSLGSVHVFGEENMNAFTALAGCAPGMLFHIMDAFVEAGVSIGLGRESSGTIAASLMTGCGLWAEQSGAHPVALREQSTSPAGMTIAGLNVLDRTGVRGHIIDAVCAALRRGLEMEAASKSE